MEEKYPGPPNITQHETGAIRESRLTDTKYDSIWWGFFRRVAERCGVGWRKYGDSLNYRKGLPIEDTYNHAIEHLIRWNEDRIMGRIAKEDHLAAAAWNIMVLMRQEELRDDQSAVRESRASLYPEPGNQRGPRP